MLFRKYLSRLGIGSAEVDLILSKETYELGEELEGYFLIKGGTIEQNVQQIECDLVMTKYPNLVEEIIETKTILVPRPIHPGESVKLSFSFTIPVTIPITEKDITYRFKTKLVFVEGGVESRDVDAIQITGNHVIG